MNVGLSWTRQEWRPREFLDNFLHPKEKHFRFLDLPFEIRNHVYDILLCTHPPANPFPLDRIDVVAPPTKKTSPTSCLLGGKPGIGILLLNRQIHLEAMDAMLRGNLFVRIISKGVNHVATTIEFLRQFPFRRIRPGERAFNHVLTHVIEWHAPADKALDGLHDTVLGYLILHRDLDLFCSTIRQKESLHCKQYTRRIQHTVAIHDPFKKTLSPDFLEWESKNQEYLLQPYRNFRGFTHFTLKGNISPTLASTLTREIGRPQPGSSSIEDTIDKVIKLREVGNSHFQCGNLVPAAEAYRRAKNCIDLLCNGNEWSKLAAGAESALLSTLAELHWSVQLDLLQIVLECMHDFRDQDPTRFKHVSKAARDLVRSMAVVDSRINTTWRPDPSELAKCTYRVAVFLRMSGDLDQAEEMIQQSLRFNAADPLFRREEMKIRDTRAACHNLSR